MVDTFIRHIRNKSIFDPSKIYLLASSGGMDSMCLGNLLTKAEIPFEIAHVNFQLRAKESDEDEEFLRKWANSSGITFHVHHADTYAFASHRNISTQMAAREIRYDWFEKLRAERNLAGIILAHHEDDQIETIFLNLLRGTGIEGIYGMAERRGWLIRPLLIFGRYEIKDYVLKNQLEWREDSSNEKTDYKRNKLRHIGLPALYANSEDARSNLLNSFARLKDTGKAFNALFENWAAQKIKVSEGMQTLPLTDIGRTAGAASLLYFWLRPYGFNSDQAQDILESCQTGESGKLFESTSHLLNLDRDQLILAPLPVDFNSILISESDIDFILTEEKYEIIKLEGKEAIDKTRQNAMLDLERLSFPLEIRTWQEGDRFIPLGMKNTKKISDFLIDLKVPVVKKHTVKVLLSEGQVAWVIGYRIADWAKSTAATRKLLYLKKTINNA
ncbi:tRNA(Ile)-lysidine synthase [Algoriphagus ratkowskyi]|uniref:tRNA(Ile)-lysidine synthase n=1 Tax=Algoriphagus ratkowskyi TaxID=57028 RepID=A0A2W7QQ76_9BACT|nr:tRNA lysidine(34) synthetase TilS [Algoriphagus ratkowskyi]PZX50698.1 tRNA(Ile)-lysidine synthase [Algoriphagus ratkowskyi]TXD75810.1 tRNA lysidine(34) synthetase TilS [Algoriphagus ratkowskyi]